MKDYRLVITKLGLPNVDWVVLNGVRAGVTNTKIFFKVFFKVGVSTDYDSLKHFLCYAIVKIHHTVAVFVA